MNNRNDENQVTEAQLKQEFLETFRKNLADSQLRAKVLNDGVKARGALRESGKPVNLTSAKFSSEGEFLTEQDTAVTYVLKGVSKNKTFDDHWGLNVNKPLSNSQGIILDAALYLTERQMYEKYNKTNKRIAADIRHYAQKAFSTLNLNDVDIGLTPKTQYKPSGAFIAQIDKSLETLGNDKSPQASRLAEPDLKLFVQKYIDHINTYVKDHKLASFAKKIFKGKVKMGNLKVKDDLIKDLEQIKVNAANMVDARMKLVDRFKKHCLEHKYAGDDKNIIAALKNLVNKVNNEPSKHSLLRSVLFQLKELDPTLMEKYHINEGSKLKFFMTQKKPLNLPLTADDTDSESDSVHPKKPGE